jgi:Heterokaryon incompatibility protein (HET)
MTSILDGVHSNINDQVYQYKRLESPSGIRVLELQGNNDGVLSCSIQHVDISKAQYSALSYAWGNPEKSFRLEVQDENNQVKGSILLTKTIYNALTNLWNTIGIQPKIFWADQICINQNDDVEKGHQVSMMNRVYRNAQQVVTYLGPQEPFDREVISLIKSAHHFIDTSLATNNTNKASLLNHSEVAAKLQAGLLRDPTLLPGLRTILRGEWCRRLWMVPENVVNRYTIMLRGNLVVPWIAVVNVSSFISSYISDDSALFPDHEEASSIGLTVMRNLHQDLNHPEGPEHVALLEQIWCFESFQCADQRDKIYALLSISRDTPLLNITPDYTKPVEYVFRHSAARLLETSSSLKLLRFSVRDPFEHPTLPTWVPAWGEFIHQRRALIQSFSSYLPCFLFLEGMKTWRIAVH